MSLFNIFNISGSGMSAQSLRLNTTASNLANSESVGSSADEVYRTRSPVFATIMDNAREGYTQGGVEVKAIVESKESVRQEYNPGHPMSNDQGYIFHSNVNPMSEMANMMSASRSYQNNVEIANTAKQLMLRTLQLGQ